jgi:hypothetical protein
VVQPASDGSVRFYIKVNERSENNSYQKFPVRLIDTISGREVDSRIIEIDKNWKSVSLKAQPGNTYRLVVENKGWIRFVVPDNQWLAFKNIPMYSVMGKLWFYAGSQQTYFYFSNKSKEQPVFFDPKGKKADVEKVNDLNLYRLNVGAANNGWWSVDATEYKSLQFHDKLQLFFPYNHITATDRGRNPSSGK